MNVKSNGPRQTLAWLAAAVVLVTGCESAASIGDLRTPPAEVQASFKRFADSLVPRIQDSLFRNGFGKYDGEATGTSSAPVVLRTDIPAVSPGDAKADLYEGIIEGEVQRSGDATTRWPLSLHFGRVPGTSKWVLLVSSGYPDDGQPRTPASSPRLPALALMRVMPLFTDSQEWQRWWELSEKRRASMK